MPGFLMKRGATPVVPLDPSGSEFASEDLRLYPALVEFITCSAWPDGSSRTPGSLLAFIDDGRVKLCLNDRDQDLVLFVTVEGLCLAFEQADEVLRDPRAEWRPSRGGRTRRSGK